MKRHFETELWLWVYTLKCTMTWPIWRPIKQVTIAIRELQIGHSLGLQEVILESS